MARRTEPRIRFWAKVDIQGQEECWLWTGCTTNGYGKFDLGGRGGKRIYAHRFAYQQFIGDIPHGLQLDHLCRVRSCVNPAHLEAVTPRENVLRGDTIPARRMKQTHCIHGHEFSPQNTRRASDGSRLCVACRDQRNRSRYPNAIRGAS